MSYCTVVTGSEGGIGKAVVELLRSRGEAVFAVDARGGDLVLDLLATDAVEKLGAAVREKYDGVKGFVHCAGFDAAMPLGMIGAEVASKLFELHAGFPMRFLGWLGKPSNHAPEGTAGVLVSSLSAHEGAKAHVAYAAAKGAVEGLLKPAAAELIAKGIRLNEVVLGVVDTEMSRSWINRLSDEQRAELETKYPLGFGRPEDVAVAIAFLLGDQSRWIVGQKLVCDGGHLLA